MVVLEPMRYEKRLLTDIRSPMQWLPGEDLCLLMDFLAVCWLCAGMLLFLTRKGVSVDCEVCQGVENTCTGPTRSCPPVFDTCGIVVMGGKQGFNGIDKICTHAQACKQSFTRINVGRDIAVWSVLDCCTGDECTNKNPALPKVNTQLNGKQCLASLVSGHQKYEEEEIGCGGDEFYCFELTGNATTPTGISSEIKMKGCTTESVCVQLTSGLTYIVPLSVVGRGTCWVASVAPSNVPGLSRLLPFLGILLLNGFL